MAHGGVGIPSAAALLLAAVLGSAGCTLERRPDLDGGEAPDSLPELIGSPARDSVRAVLAAVNDALRLGDVTRVAQLSAPGAVLIDQEEGVSWTRRDAAAALPRPLVGRGSSLGWSLSASSFEPLGPSAALLSNRYTATVSGEDVPWTAVETWVLVRTDEGWRLRYLHRSRGTGARGGS